MSNMEDCTGSKPATRPETAIAHNVNETQGDHNAGASDAESSRPMLSLVSPSPASSTHVEEGFFDKGAADDKAAMEMYAAMLPRGYNLGRISPRYLMLAGAAVLLLVGVAAGRHLPGGHSSGAVTAPPAEASPTVVPPAPAPAPAPAAAAPAPAPSVERTAAPAPALAVAAPEPTPPAAAAPAGAAAEPIAAVPTPPAATEPAANKEAPAPAPAVAAAPAEPSAAQPEKPAAPAAVAPEPEPTALPVAETKPAEAAPARPKEDAVPAEAQNVQACREAIKKRDLKVVSTRCEAALAAEASLAKPLLAFAKAQFEKGKSAQAAVWARKIVQVNGSLADAYLIMGAAEQEAHHAAAAKTAYQRYLELAPKGPYADDVRSSLKSL